MRDDIVVHRPDGRHIPLVTWGTPLTLGRSSQPDAAVWVLEDLTALHQAEAARRDSEGRLRAVVETMGEGLIVQDRRGLVVESNPTACGLLLLQPEVLRGQSLFTLGWVWLREDGSLLPTEEHPAQAVLRTGRPVRNVVLGISSLAAPGLQPGGRVTRWLLMNAMPLGCAAPQGVVTTFSDVTHVRHAQEVLRTSEEKYRVLIESLPLMVVQTDAQLRVVYSNPAMRSTTGYDETALAEATFWESFIHADHQTAFREMVQQALERQPGRTELRYRARDGSERIAYALAQPASSSGITLLMVDVTHQRRLEQDLQRAQRLEMVGRLSSGIAHDFNNLLLVIMGLTDLARSSLPPDHAVQKDLEQINEASDQAAQLAGQLLAFSRTRRTPARRAYVGQVARRTLEMLRPTLPSQIDLETQLTDDPLAVPADETQLQQILMNLCLNARDAITAMAKGAREPHQGKILVRIEPVCGPGENGASQGHWARLVVEDNGPGMTEQVRARIFEPFFSTKEHGTGLGLAVVQQIVEGCGGRVEVTSRPGAGARFEVWLPLLEDDKVTR